MAFSMLVTLDGSTWSEGVLDAAARIAHETHAKVYLLRLFGPAHDVGRAVAGPGPGAVSPAMYEGGIGPYSHIDEVETTTQAATRGDAEALAYLRPIAERFAGLDVEPIARESGHLAQDIIAMAERLGVDLIAMATHGRTGVAHALLGSVAEAVVRSGEFPVLIVRPSRG
jgi:nucleotide-binding universal stress UspA family protein